MSRRFAATLMAFAFAACGGSPRARVATPSNTPTAPTHEAPTIAGHYRAPHTVLVVCDGGDDGWCEEPVEDSMTVTERGLDRLEVSIELAQTNGHTCSFAGTLALDATTPRRWTFNSDHPDEGPCTLILEQSATELRLQSEGCRYYCGARASLDATFPYPAS